MDMPYIPAFDRALQELKPLTTSLYEQFPEVATRAVVPYFHGRGQNVNHRLATDMLRYEICRFLQEESIEAELYEEPQSYDEVSTNQLPNNGIEGVFRGYQFKVLRSRDGDVPPPGRSTRRKSYFHQLRLPLFPDQPDYQDRPNIVILWDCDPSYTTFTLRLAVPLETSGAYGRVRCEYNKMIPHPATDISLHPQDQYATGQKAELDLTYKETREAEDKHTEQHDDIWREDKAS